MPGGIIQGGRPLNPTRQRTQSGEIVTADEVAGSVRVLSDLLDVADNVSPDKGTILVGDGAQFAELPVGADGDVLTADSAQTLGVKWAPASSGSTARGWLIFGAVSVGSSTSTRHLWPGPGDAGQAPVSIDVAQIRAPTSGTLQNLYVRHGEPDGNGNSVAYTVLKNGVATTLAVTIASTSLNASDTVNSVSILAGDLISVRITKTTGIATSPRGVYASLEIA